jgi:hypothetical protein
MIIDIAKTCRREDCGEDPKPLVISEVSRIDRVKEEFY